MPDTFSIPTFRKHTQARLLSKQMTPDDRKYTVSVLGTMLLTYVERASKKNCLSVGQALVHTTIYYVVTDFVTIVIFFTFDTHAVFWQEYIYTKCQNINRKPPSSASSEEPPVKCSRLKGRTIYNYPSVSTEKDEESYKRNLDLLATEQRESNPSTTKIKELMRRTFHQRRKWILEGANTVQSIYM